MDFDLSSQGLLFFTGLFAEGCFFLLYTRFRLRLKRLNGTGKVTDMEIARNWQQLFRVLMVAVPVLLYWFKLSVLPT